MHITEQSDHVIISAAPHHTTDKFIVSHPVRWDDEDPSKEGIVFGSFMKYTADTLALWILTVLILLRKTLRE